MKICTFCGSQADNAARVCPSCGSKEFEYRCPNCSTMFTGKFCPSCGTTYDAVPKTCPNCGRKYFSKACPDCGYNGINRPIAQPQTPGGTDHEQADSVHNISSMRMSRNSGPGTTNKNIMTAWLLGIMGLFTCLLPLPIIGLVMAYKEKQKGDLSEQDQKYLNGAVSFCTLDIVIGFIALVMMLVARRS